MKMPTKKQQTLKKNQKNYLIDYKTIKKSLGKN
jgi:hypothetical protein